MNQSLAGCLIYGYFSGMENNTQTAEPVQDRKAPNLENVKKWVRADLEAAHYLLGLVLIEFPEVIDRMAQDLADFQPKRPE